MRPADLTRRCWLYVGLVILIGAAAFVSQFPLSYPRPALFAVLLLSACLISVWKVNLPIPLTSGSTLSVAHAAEFASLLVLGPRHAMLIAVAAAWTQCTFRTKQPYPLYRTVFSAATQAITMTATAAAYQWLGGSHPSFDFIAMSGALVGAMATYFLVNTGLVAGAIALSSDRRLTTVWCDDFLWSGVNFMVASTAGVVAAIVIERGYSWVALMMLAPVYLTYRTYELFVKRLEDQTRHALETRRLHEETVQALLVARQAEQALREETERLSVTLRSVGDGVIATDLDGTILLMNKVAEDLTGWSSDQAVGQSLAHVFQTFDPETWERCDNAIGGVADDSRTLDAGRRSVVLVARDLTEHPVEESLAPIRDGDGSAIGIVLAFRDISTALRMQEERAKASKLASLGLLAGGMAHDFNNVLISILGNLAMARATMTRASSSADWLAEAENACVRARHLTWQLLTFSKGSVPKRKTVSLGPLLQESIGLALSGSGVTCTLDIPRDLWTVDADVAQLVQAIGDVALNARQAMPHGGELTIRAENVSEETARWESALRVKPGRYVRVSVSDTGIGIPKEHLGRIFDPYFSTKQGATGLGLATTYSIVKNHGGFLGVTSRPGYGTTIHMSWPAGGNQETTQETSIAFLPGMDRPRVLIVDHEANMRTLATNMLEFLGYAPQVTQSASSAVEYFKQALDDGCPFDVVLLDSTGGVSGVEMIAHLEALDPTVKAILMSGIGQDPAAARCQSYGFKAAIAKPFTLQELNATLQSVMQTRAWHVH
ncbi:MAG TPA: ATP-binding protein [Vicinamibacterales bacterium]|nr:ATP-binding protein [Vicinamibacterales bacterium]